MCSATPIRTKLRNSSAVSTGVYNLEEPRVSRIPFVFFCSCLSLFSIQVLLNLAQRQLLTWPRENDFSSFSPLLFPVPCPLFHLFSFVNVWNREKNEKNASDAKPPSRSSHDVEKFGRTAAFLFNFPRNSAFSSVLSPKEETFSQTASTSWSTSSAGTLLTSSLP